MQAIRLALTTIGALIAISAPAFATPGLSYEGDYPTREACEAAAPDLPHQCRWKPSKNLYELWVNNS